MVLCYIILHNYSCWFPGFFAWNSLGRGKHFSKFSLLAILMVFRGTTILYFKFMRPRDFILEQKLIITTWKTILSRKKKHNLWILQCNIYTAFCFKYYFNFWKLFCKQHGNHVQFCLPQCLVFYIIFNICNSNKI